MSVADIVRLFAVPIFVLVSYRDLKYQRVPARVWYPLVGLGVVTIGYDAWQTMALGAVTQRLLLVRVGTSVMLLLAIAVGFYYLGIVDVSIARAFAVVGLLFPVYPTYRLGPITLPLFEPSHGVLSLSVLANAAAIGILYPVGYAFWNALHGQIAPVMFVGRPIPVEDIADRPGRLLQTTDGFVVTGPELAVIRDYLSWRNVTVPLLQQQPNALRSGRDAEDRPDDNHRAGGSSATEDPWQADEFVNRAGDDPDVTVAELRQALELLADAEFVWVSANFPFLVPITGGILVGLTAGDFPGWLLALAT